MLKKEHQNSKHFKIGEKGKVKYSKMFSTSSAMSSQQQLFYHQLATMMAYITTNMYAVNSREESIIENFLIYGFLRATFQRV